MLAFCDIATSRHCDIIIRLFFGVEKAIFLRVHQLLYDNHRLIYSSIPYSCPLFSSIGAAFRDWNLGYCLGGQATIIMEESRNFSNL